MSTLVNGWTLNPEFCLKAQRCSIFDMDHVEPARHQLETSLCGQLLKTLPRSQGCFTQAWQEAEDRLRLSQIPQDTVLVSREAQLELPDVLGVLSSALTWLCPSSPSLASTPGAFPGG